jgi:competence protein ComEC
MSRSLFTSICSVCVFCLFLPIALADSAKSLQIYFIDVEGGQSTLIVDPAKESLLVDTGWPGFDGRDADRIVAAAKDAGITHINYLVLTHYHGDHAGGVPQLASRLKIDAFVDHGPNAEDSDSTRTNYANYLKVVGDSKHIVAKPGDSLPFKGMSVQFLAAAGEAIHSPLPGAGQPNPLCASEPEAVVDPTENAQSVGMLITYKKFRMLDMGDLTKRKERNLVCPNNLIGTVDLYLTTHHGLDLSNSKAFVDAIHPRVAIMNNGAHKGGIPSAWQIVHDSPGLQDLWQLHYAVDGGKDHNVSDDLIANLGDIKVGGLDEGHYIKVTAEPNATFTVSNSRDKVQKTYKK